MGDRLPVGEPSEEGVTLILDAEQVQALRWCLDAGRIVARISEGELRDADDYNRRARSDTDEVEAVAEEIRAFARNANRRIGIESFGLIAATRLRGWADRLEPAALSTSEEEG